MLDKWDVDNPPELIGISWQDDLGGYIRDAEPSKKQKSENWSVAIGLQAVDGLTPSKFGKFTLFVRETPEQLLFS